GAGGLLQNTARQKHVIIISDGDPAPPTAPLVAAYKKAQVSVSTISVYPHGGQMIQTMQQIAKSLMGRHYGPINQNPNQLPQIFIKEATVVKRSIIYEEAGG